MKNLYTDSYRRHCGIIALLILAVCSSSPAQVNSNKDYDQIKTILRQYQATIEKLDTTGSAQLFASESKIFEQGGDEGSFLHYAAHHLAPELGEFESFKFSNYKVNVTIDLPYAFAEETYNYTIKLKQDTVPVYRFGAATSVLKKYDDGWKILINHSSSHK